MNSLKDLLAKLIISTIPVGYIWFGYICLKYQEYGIFFFLYLCPILLIIINLIGLAFEWAFERI